MPESAYIHIPFCKKKCKYCSFVSYENADNTEQINGYIFSLMKEISENYRGENLNTLYIGGGTPSIVSADMIKKIVQKFKFNKNSEITLELNPDDADRDFLCSLNQIGINRLSIGSQTFDDNILELIGRRHNSEQISKAVNLAKEVGFENISLDLIYGLPTQNPEGLKNDLNKFLELDIQHISTYGLKIEVNSFFGKNRPLNLPDDDEQADMYELINEILEEKGYMRYEISNFAKSGFESRHNLNYWNNNEYYGFGVSAHGYVDGVRYSNYSSLKQYMENPAMHEYGKFLTDKEKLEEEIFLGLRKTKGINTEKIKKNFGIDFELRYKNILEKYSDYFLKTGSGYALTLKGTLLSNVILSEFI